MIQAINNRVIATPIKEESTTESGIILTKKDEACVRYKVLHTTEVTKDLQDKVVYAEAKYKNYQLPDTEDGQTLVVIPVEEILAVK